jgi:ribonuclease BN (tRNA processing enzyme)
MIIGMIGVRGTVPTSDTGTVCFLIDHRYLFECPSEIVQSFQKYQKKWEDIPETAKDSEMLSLGRPTFSKIKYIILTHLHYDHWGGLSHIIHRIMLLEKEMREGERLKLVIPEKSTIVFQQRMNELFNYSISTYPLPDDEFLYRLLTIEVGHSVMDVLQIIVLKGGEFISLDREYTLFAKENDHLELGSFSYKLEIKKTKLKVAKTKELGIPFNKILKQIEKSRKPIKVGNKEISRAEIFYDQKTILCYSGDTKIDPKLFSFFNDTQILIHETTYLNHDDSYHLDCHSDFNSLVEKLELLPELVAFVPVHFSTRYTDDEITAFLNSLPQRSYEVINPLENSIFQIKPDNSLNTFE